ncbi:Tryptophan synthase alpha chain [Moellerella wisconsensis]|nr:Tryptophan synthase alpha chain [Moellerella wisconsensis]
MERYQQLFASLKAKNQGAFVPFITLGDPDAELSLDIVDALIAGGADALEIGIPFSDPFSRWPDDSSRLTCGHLKPKSPQPYALNY